MSVEATFHVSKDYACRGAPRRLLAGAAVERGGLPPLLDAPTAAQRPSVVRKADVDHGLPSVIVLRVTLMVSPPRPCVAGQACPSPDRARLGRRTRGQLAAHPRLAMPASTLTPISVWARASERKLGGILFRGKYLRGGSTPLLLAQAHPRPGAATITRII